jgi:hypothetical protein
MAVVPMAHGGDAGDVEPAGRATLSQPEGEESPAERWQRLKNKYHAEVAAEAPGWTPTGSGLPTNSAEPFPELSDAPRWVVAAPEAAAVEAPEPKTTAWRATAVSAETLPDLTGDPFAPQPPVNVSPAVEAQILTAAGRKQEPNEVPPMPVGTGGVRRLRPIGDISPFYDTMVDEDIREYADQRAAEYDVKFADEQFQPRAFPDIAMAWEPSNLYHYPLYFEDPALERYGHTRPFLIQPFFSGARFMGQLVALPYQMTIDPPCKEVYALGWYRPGESAPKLKYQVPFNAQAAAVQAGVVTGLFFLIP